MADDQALPPKPRPRRRRTDIDPNAPSPPVANERRRRRSADPVDGAPPPGPVDAIAGAAPSPPADAPATQTDLPPDATVPFHVPGLATAGADKMASVEVVEMVEAVEAAPAVTPVDQRRSWLRALDDRSPDPNICPFLRAAGADGLVAPIEMPDAANRCAALAEAVPQSLRQQELVCLSTGHVNCPRYLRGAAVAVETPTPAVRAGRTMSPAMLGSLVVLVMAMSASVAFVLARGGLAIEPPGPAASASASAIAAVSPSPGASTAPAVTPTSSAAVTPAPSATPTSIPTPSQQPSPTPSAAPTSDRYLLLTACPDAPDCWIYRVRRGDNVYSIARYFGVSMDSIYDRNPWLRSTGLRAGQELRLPRPTR